MSRTINMAEVAKHNTKDGLWIIFNNGVYDVTKFLYEHPGGANTLLDVAGTDSTQAFEDVGHSVDARIMMRKYKIGELPAHERDPNINPCVSMSGGYSGGNVVVHASDSQSIISKLKWVLIALTGALLIGFLVKKYTSQNCSC